MRPEKRKLQLVEDVAHALDKFFGEDPGTFGCHLQAANMLIEAGILRGHNAGDFFLGNISDRKKGCR